MSFNVHHGSPYDFEYFSHAHMGNGEGAQAIAYGTYLAESTRVANSYKTYFGEGGMGYRGLLWNGVELAEGTPQRHAASIIIDVGVIEARRLFNEWYQDAVEREAAGELRGSDKTPAYWGEMVDMASKVSRKSEIKESLGRLYGVNVDAEKNDFLDWDVPLSKQSKYVKDRLALIGGWRIGEGDPTGEQIYRNLESFTRSDKAASEYLQGLGVPGVKYLDGYSREKGRGRSNYVVFDPSILQITSIDRVKVGRCVESDDFKVPELSDSDLQLFTRQARESMAEEVKEQSQHTGIVEKLTAFKHFLTNNEVPATGPGEIDMGSLFSQRGGSAILDAEAEVRRFAREKGMYAIVDMEWTSELAGKLASKKCLEVMAGAGWLSKALIDQGVDVVSTDSYDAETWGDIHGVVCDVIKMDAVEAIENYRDAEVLLVSWPPYDDPIIEAVAEAWGSNRPMVYIGEGQGGCTATDHFHEGFVLTDRLSIPSWSGMHDYVQIGYYHGHNLSLDESVEAAIRLASEGAVEASAKLLMRVKDHSVRLNAVAEAISNAPADIKGLIDAVYEASGVYEKEKGNRAGVSTGM